MSGAFEIVILCGGLSSEREVSLRSGKAVAEVLPGARLVELPGLGHLAHEERPDEIAALVLEVARGRGLLPPG